MKRSRPGSFYHEAARDAPTIANFFAPKQKAIEETVNDTQDTVPPSQPRDSRQKSMKVNTGDGEQTHPAVADFTLDADADFKTFIDNLEAEMHQEDKARKDEQEEAPKVLKKRDANLKENLEKSLETGDLTSGVYQKMLRSFDSEDQEKYSACASDEERKDFRIQWCQRKLGDLTVVKKHQKAWQVVDEKRGEYITVEKLCEKYGWAVDAEKATRCASNYALKCSKMGGKWVHYDKMGETWMVLFMEIVHTETFSQCWQLCESYESKRRQVTTDKEQEDDHTAGKKQGTEQPAAKEQDVTPKADKTKDTEKEKKPPAKKPKTNLDDALNSMEKIKSKYMVLSSKVNCMIASIDGHEEGWGWAANPQNVGILKKAVEELQNKIAELGDAEILHSDKKDLKAKLGSEHLLFKCREFMGLESAVLKLEEAYNTLWKRHKASGH